MFKKINAEIIEVDEGFSVKPKAPNGLIYSQAGKKLFVSCELLVGPFLTGHLR